MKSLSIIPTGLAISSLFLTLVSSTPVPDSELIKRTCAPAIVLFIGAADASFTAEIPLGVGDVPISNPLSVSHITIENGGWHSGGCTFYGIDGGVFPTSNNADMYDFGPPQTIVSARCDGYRGPGFPGHFPPGGECPY